MSSQCRCAGRGFEFCDCSEQRAEPSTKAEALLLDAIRRAEWNDKHIHPFNGESYQTWRLTIYLPVRLSETDKSPEAALHRALGYAAHKTPATAANLARDIQAAVIRRRSK